MNVAKICEVLAFMELPAAEQIRLANAAVGLPSAKVPAFLDDKLWDQALMAGLVRAERRAPREGEVVCADGDVLVLTDKGRDFLTLNTN
jgi:hypothetical protein